MTAEAVYPLACELLDAAIAARQPRQTASTNAFTIGPSVLRPGVLAKRPVAATFVEPDADDEKTPSTEALLGELVDMAFVGASDDNEQPEVHLTFKADVLGGVTLRLRQTPNGMLATFFAASSTARRELEQHVSALQVHLELRGFRVAEIQIRVQEPG